MYPVELQRVFDNRGTKIVALAEKMLLEGVKSEVLKKPLMYTLHHRKDLVRPTLMSLACEAVNGTPETVSDAAVAMILECYRIAFIDDLIDETHMKNFSYTLPKRFGMQISLLVSIIMSTKAYFALSQLSDKIDPARYMAVNITFKDFIIRMGEGEVRNMKVKQEKKVNIQRLIEVFKMESADIEACTKIGAIIGKGTEEEVKALAKYGRLLGTIFLLREDLMHALNFSVQLKDKLIQGAYPFPVLWALNNSKDFQHFLDSIEKQSKVTPQEIKRCVQLLFNSGALDHVVHLMETKAEESINALSQLKGSEAKKKLEFIARVQPQMVFQFFSSKS